MVYSVKAKCRDNTAKELGNQMSEMPVLESFARNASDEALSVADDAEASSENKAVIPKHIAIIPDGNRRWARARGLQPEDGHRYGFLKTAPIIIRSLWKKQVEVSTLWLFSPENWKRSEYEVSQLMMIYQEFVSLITPIAIEADVRIQMIGRRSRIPKYLLETILFAEKASKNCKRQIFQLAIDCGGLADLIEVASRLMKSGFSGTALDDLSYEKIRELQISISDPDLVIRSSGVARLSGFLPLQTCYSELYFCDEKFPDMSEETINNAINSYQHKMRRFGE